MMETSLRTGVVEKIMNGEESNFLPQFVIDKMLASVPLRGLIHAVAQNGSSAYDDGDDDLDEDGKVLRLTVVIKRGARSQPVVNCWRYLRTPFQLETNCLLYTSDAADE